MRTVTVTFSVLAGVALVEVEPLVDVGVAAGEVVVVVGEMDDGGLT